MANPKINIIAAIGKNRELGLGNQLLWHIPEDLKHFKEMTLGKACIMGQKTYESIGRPLPDRLNVILSKETDLNIEGCVVSNSIEDAINITGDYSDEIFVIGGGSIYAQFIDRADKLFLTLVDEKYDADVFFPEYNKFKCVKEEPWENFKGLKYKFTEWEKN